MARLKVEVEIQPGFYPSNVVKVIRFLRGAFSAIYVITFLALCTPIYFIRVLVILLAKVLRTDLGEILNAQSNTFIPDLSTGKAPRDNIVICMTIAGKLTEKELRFAVWNNWLRAIDKKNGTLLYSKFQQYPTQWMGFTFYKHAFDTFSLDNHVHAHQEFGADNPVSEDEIVALTEKLLNAPFKPETSLWELHLVNNYVNPKISGEPEMSILLFKLHHSLADGFSLLKTFVEGLCGSSLKDYKMPVPKQLRNSFMEKAKFVMTSPINGFHQFAKINSQKFRPSPLKIPDEQKHWHQYCAKADLIPVKNIHEIKNKFGVTFTSVLISAISAGANKILKTKRKLGELTVEDDGSMLAFIALPVPGHNGNLINQSTGNMFDIPTSDFRDSIDRLRKCDENFEATRASVIPYLVRYMVLLGGSLFTPIVAKLFKNTTFSTGITSFPGIPQPVSFFGKKCISTDFVVGSLQGNSAIGTRVMRYGDHIRISAVAEKAVLAREEVADFTKYMYDEIEALHNECKSQN